ncbi:MAG: hypothetical protein JXR58_01560 [Bacteroidales bacterium]|nr:hypothetical protein [Bacteroidales bacterium]
MHFKHFEDVQVFQYFDNDSLNAEVTHSIKLDENGNILAEYYSGYQKQQNSSGDMGYSIMDYYDNNKLKEKTTYFLKYDGRIYKSLYYYNDSLLEREETFGFKGIARPISDIDSYRIKGYNIIKEANENAEKWELYEIRLFEYYNEGVNGCLF